MTPIDRLMAVREIEALKARYFRCMDMKDWAGLEATFAPDQEADFRDATSPRNETLLTFGAGLYVANTAPILQLITTTHHGHTPEIEILSATTAKGIWAMEDLLWVGDGAPVPYKTLRGFGHYHETYERLAEGWRIKTIRLSRLRIDLT
jgi:hypothetical protein